MTKGNHHSTSSSSSFLKSRLPSHRDRDRKRRRQSAPAAAAAGGGVAAAQGRGGDIEVIELDDTQPQQNHSDDYDDEEEQQQQQQQQQQQDQDDSADSPESTELPDHLRPMYEADEVQADADAEQQPQARDHVREQQQPVQQQQPQQQQQHQRERDSPNMVVTQLDADRTDGEDDVQDDEAEVAAAAEDIGTTMPTQSYPMPQPTHQNDDENGNDGTGSNVRNNDTHQYDDPDETQDVTADDTAGADPRLLPPLLPQSTATTATATATGGNSSDANNTNQAEAEEAAEASANTRQTITDEISNLIERQVQAETQRLRGLLSNARQTISCLQSDLQQTHAASRTTVETMTKAHKVELSLLQRQIDSNSASSNTDHERLRGEVRSLRSELGSAKSRLTEIHAKYQKMKRIAKQRDATMKSIAETVQEQRQQQEQQDGGSPSFSPSQREPYFMMGGSDDDDNNDDDDVGHDNHDDEEGEVDDEETVPDVCIAGVDGGGGGDVPGASVAECKPGSSDDGGKGRRGGKTAYVQQLFPFSPVNVDASERRIDARRDDTTCSNTGAATSNTGTAATKGLASRHKHVSSRKDEKRKGEETTSKSALAFSVPVTSKNTAAKEPTAVDEQVSSGKEGGTKKSNETPVAVGVEQKKKVAKSLSTIEVARVTDASEKTQAKPLSTVEIGQTAPDPSSEMVVEKPISKTPRNPYATIVSSKSVPKRSTPPTTAKATTSSSSNGKDRSDKPRSSSKRSRSASPHSVRTSTATAESKKTSVSMGDGGDDSGCGNDIRLLVASAAIAAAQKHGNHQSKKRKGGDGSVGHGKENRDNGTTNQKSIEKPANGGSGAPIPSFSLSLSGSSSITGIDGAEGVGTGAVSTSLVQGSKAGGGSSGTKSRRKRTTGNTIVIDSDDEETSEDEGTGTKETRKTAGLNKDELCAPCDLPASMAPPPHRQSKKSTAPETDVPSRSKSVSGRYAYGIKARSSSASANYGRGGDDQRKSNDPEERSYKYQEVVRGKDKRKAMRGHECEQCKEFYDTVCDAEGGKVFDRNKMICDHSRHRSNHSPQQTPQDFWELSFMDEKRARDTQDV